VAKDQFGGKFLRRALVKELIFFRRKKKAAHKAVSNDDKKLHTTLKRMGMNEIPGIEEVNIFHSDNVINFVHPKGRFCLSPLF